MILYDRYDDDDDVVDDDDDDGNLSADKANELLKLTNGKTEQHYFRA
jgi:hypothetical protein